MTSRINIARPQSNPTHYDPHNLSNSAPNPGYRTSVSGDPDDSIEKLRTIASKVEDFVDQYSQPLRPHLGSIGRFLIVVTFLEDSWRIVTQWSSQMQFMNQYRSFPKFLAGLFLILNVITMVACAPLVVLRRYTEYAVCGLLAVIIVQGLGYGLIFDLSFFLRNMSVIGGLVMVFSDAMATQKKSFAGIPQLSENDRRKYFQLAGRVLLVLLFVGFILQGSWSFGRILVSLMGLAASVLVAIGFKAKYAGVFLVILLSIFNVWTNNWWTYHSGMPKRDFLKYDFFQTLSIVGGLMLLVSIGPGGLSVDENKKNR